MVIQFLVQSRLLVVGVAAIPLPLREPVVVRVVVAAEVLVLDPEEPETTQTFHHHKGITVETLPAVELLVMAVAVAVLERQVVMHQAQVAPEE